MGEHNELLKPIIDKLEAISKSGSSIDNQPVIQLDHVLPGTFAVKINAQELLYKFTALHIHTGNLKSILDPIVRSQLTRSLSLSLVCVLYSI